MKIILLVYTHAALWSRFNPLEGKKKIGENKSTTALLQAFVVLQPLTEGRA